MDSKKNVVQKYQKDLDKLLLFKQNELIAITQNIVQLSESIDFIRTCAFTVSSLKYNSSSNCFPESPSLTESTNTTSNKFEESPAAVTETISLSECDGVEKTVSQFCTCSDNAMHRDARFRVIRLVTTGCVAKPSVGVNAQYDWCVYVRGAPQQPNLQSLVDRVVFMMHSSFLPHTQVVDTPPYIVERTGWGTAPVRILIQWRDARVPPLEVLQEVCLPDPTQPQREINTASVHTVWLPRDMLGLVIPGESLCCQGCQLPVCESHRQSINACDEKITSEELLSASNEVIVQDRDLPDRLTCETVAQSHIPTWCHNLESALRELCSATDFCYHQDNTDVPLNHSERRQIVLRRLENRFKYVSLTWSHLEEALTCLARSVPLLNLNSADVELQDLCPFLFTRLDILPLYNVVRVRSAEWMRARLLRHLLLSLYWRRHEQDDDRWSTKKIMLWCRHQGLSLTDHTSCGQPPRLQNIDVKSTAATFNTKTPAAHLRRRLRARLRQEETRRAAQRHVDVVDDLEQEDEEMEEQEVPRFSILRRALQQPGVSVTVLPAASPRVRYVTHLLSGCDLRGFSVTPINLDDQCLEDTPQLACHGVQEMLFACGRALMRDLLLAALALYREKRLPPPHTLLPDDIHRGIASRPASFSALTNLHLGVDPELDDTDKLNE